jgi:hypothetical protein
MNVHHHILHSVALQPKACTSHQLREIFWAKTRFVQFHAQHVGATRPLLGNTLHTKDTYVIAGLPGYHEPMTPLYRPYGISGQEPGTSQKLSDKVAGTVH